MSKALSFDLRVRVLSAVAQGMGHRQAGDRFGVSAASVSRWLSNSTSCRSSESIFSRMGPRSISRLSVRFVDR